MKYIDKEGKISIEDSGQDKLLKWMYTHHMGRCMLKVLVHPMVSKAGGWMLDRGWSRCLIRPFVKKNQIDLDCCEKQKFRSYNDFFTRQMKSEYRPMEGNEGTMNSPCDGKLSIYPITCREGEKSSFCIKNTWYTVESLLRSKKLAQYYEGGTACVFRLTVDDYHRYCYVDEGDKSENHYLPGIFHTVNPIANDVVPIYKENAREYSLLKSRHFKTVLMMEVGALMVGRITNYHGACKVHRGQEKGRFEFGGSTIILLFQKDSVQIDERLYQNTQKGYETIVKMGEKIGTAHQD
ncbi:MAG: phosphatidylserine decarboxylase [Faecalicatena sp.]|uniref:phosphatidylserine decarboxylase n=1 Tax=Faecalicatena sp. TaxID=2005360 RepID=UPI00258561A7|nr:phosphatidylserine decarboxylase [Faecalicatena sp.]MCI6466174.1 phosphatidylserine decarboxylase [Faecalicatena sp.]MDY5619339.1 phosphatidylserine decarboxylase [Lachnospiraceae bacterium]